MNGRRWLLRASHCSFAFRPPSRIDLHRERMRCYARWSRAKELAIFPDRRPRRDREAPAATAGRARPPKVDPRDPWFGPPAYDIHPMTSPSKWVGRQRNTPAGITTIESRPVYVRAIDIELLETFHEIAPVATVPTKRGQPSWDPLRQQDNARPFRAAQDEVRSR